MPHAHLARGRGELLEPAKVRLPVNTSIVNGWIRPFAPPHVALRPMRALSTWVKPPNSRKPPHLDVVLGVFALLPKLDHEADEAVREEDVLRDLRVRVE